MIRSNTILNEFAARSLRLKEVSAYTLVTNRSILILESAKRIHDVL
jgi:hypothetical protein